MLTIGVSVLLFITDFPQQWCANWNARCRSHSHVIPARLGLRDRTV